jgi:AcrR family transcriptional regulator
MPNLGVSGTTQYEAMVQVAIRRMSALAPDLDVADIAAEVGVPREIALALFPDGAALCIAAGAHETIRLVDYLSGCAVHETCGDPVAQYRAICIGYLDWAMANPDAFEVLNSRSMFTHSRNGNIGRYNRAMHNLLASLLARAGDTNRLREGVDLAETALTTRAIVHGMAALVVHRLARHWTASDDIDEAARRNINHYLDGLFLSGPADQPIRSEA